jgi:Multiple myeloma tumor-associated
MKGGTKEYNWDAVRQMSYKDRECFLGYTTKIGYLDKGGKWKKSDWWTQVDDDATRQVSKNEIEAEKAKDKKRMRVAM